MARTDIHLDAMLRHLGAAYYESMHGRAARSDVARALETVDAHLRERAADVRSVPPPSADETAQDTLGTPGTAGPVAPTPHRRRYARRVRDVMTTDVITIDRMTPYKEIARLLAEHRISGLPVVTTGSQLAGVVSEGDLLAAEEEHARKLRGGPAREGHGILSRRRHGTPPSIPLVAGDLMTSPAITIHPEATIPSAARVMNTNRIRRLPVTDPGGKLIGVVSRRDLLSVFLRPDPEIAADAQLILDEMLAARVPGARVSVRNGVVALSGTLSPAHAGDSDLVKIATRLISDVDGVVEVVNRLTAAESESGPARESA